MSPFLAKLDRSRLSLLLVVPVLFACNCGSSKDDSATKPAPPTPVSGGNIGGGQKPAQGGWSAIPTTAEWSGAPEVGVRGSTALGCSTQAVREWLRVSCRGRNDSGGTPTNVTVTSPKSQEVLTFAAGGVASLVMPFVEGSNVTATFSWTDKSHTFRSSWARGAPRPSLYGEFLGAAAPGAKAAGPGGSCRTHLDCGAGQFCTFDGQGKGPLSCGPAGAAEMVACKKNQDCVGNMGGPKCVGPSSGNVPMCSK